MIKGIGIDIARVDRFRRSASRLADRLLTPAEKAYCFAAADPAERLAVRFAAKEAVAKALGTGFAAGISWKQIEIVRDAAGAPGVRLSGAALHRFEELGAKRCHLSLSHEKEQAVAFAVLED